MTVAFVTVHVSGDSHAMCDTPVVGAVVAFTVNWVLDVTPVTVTGVVPVIDCGHGVPSSHPPPGPGGEAVGALGIESRIAMSTGWFATLDVQRNACSG